MFRCTPAAALAFLGLLTDAAGLEAFALALVALPIMWLFGGSGVAKSAALGLARRGMRLAR